MHSSVAEADLDVRATGVRVSDDEIAVDLEDGRTITVPTLWYPRLQHATAAERANYELTGFGVSWPDVDADFSVRGLLLGRQSGESAESFKFWLDGRRKGKVPSLAAYVEHRHRKAKVVGGKLAGRKRKVG